MRFEYSGKSTNDFGVIVGSIEHSSTLSSGLEREIIKGETTDYRLVPNHFTTKYTSVIEFRRTLIKLNGSVFTPLERERIVSWLTSPKTPRKMITYNYACSNQGEKVVEYNGIFTNIEYETIAGGIYGITFTFTNDSPFVYEKLEREYTLTEAAKNPGLTLNIESHNEEYYTYPVVEIKYDGKDQNSSKVTIINHTDSNKTNEDNTGQSNSQCQMDLECLSKSPLTIDCKNLIVKGTNSSMSYEQLGWAEKDDIYWLRFLNGENELEVIATAYPINLKISCDILRKAGELFDYTYMSGYSEGTIYGDDTYRSIEHVVTEILKKKLIPTNAKDNLDTLEEIAAWIQSHPDEADAMDKTIKDLQYLVGDLPEDIDAANVVSFVQGLTKALDERVKSMENKMEWTRF